MKLSELRKDMTVYHPIYGKGCIGFVDLEMEECRVHFDKIEGRGIIFESLECTSAEDPFCIKHLYPYEVKVISLAEYNAYEEAIGEKGFKLIQSLYNPDK